MRLSLPILVAVSLGIACSSGGDGGSTPSAALDCAWLEGNNCWKSTLAQAESCLPPASETGTLSADGKTCTYASGAVITFDSALVLPLPDDPAWNFTVTSGGQSCLRLEDGANGFSLTVKDLTFTETAAGNGMQVICPDQSTFAASNPFDLLTCDSDGGLLAGLPGKAWSDTSTSISFNLIGSAKGFTSIFRCRTP